MKSATDFLIRMMTDWVRVYSAQGERSGRRLGYNGLAGQDAADGAEGAQAV
jgi:hypothetical protein